MLGIVLSRRDFRENDQKISILTKENGKKELVARGVKKIKSKNSYHLEQANLIDFNTAEGKVLEYLINATSEKVFLDIKKDIKKRLTASYILNLVKRVVEEKQKEERVFSLLFTTLGYIEKNVPDTFIVDVFILKLLSSLGFQPNIEINNDSIGFSPLLGKVVSKQELNQAKHEDENIFFCPKEELEVVQQALNFDFEAEIKLEEKKKKILHKITREFFLHHSEYRLPEYKKVL